MLTGAQYGVTTAVSFGIAAGTTALTAAAAASGAFSWAAPGIPYAGLATNIKASNEIGDWFHGTFDGAPLVSTKENLYQNTPCLYGVADAATLAWGPNTKLNPMFAYTAPAIQQKLMDSLDPYAGFNTPAEMNAAAAQSLRAAGGSFSRGGNSPTLDSSGAMDEGSRAQAAKSVGIGPYSRPSSQERSASKYNYDGSPTYSFANPYSNSYTSGISSPMLGIGMGDAGDFRPPMGPKSPWGTAATLDYESSVGLNAGVYSAPRPVAAPAVARPAQPEFSLPTRNIPVPQSRPMDFNRAVGDLGYTLGGFVSNFGPGVVGAAVSLGDVDKVGSQISIGLIQDYLLGGSFGTWRFER
ncbi:MULTISPECIES: hypothetical protein, partial [unclassified Rhizobium]|uniref:hypothetical protein n=1 Tax=unclassified Rhizobium TaxID=2613769 RepID=UPI003828EBA8